MSKYQVLWENEIDNARTPLEAAKCAATEIAMGENTSFTVIDLKTGQHYSVDLSKYGEDAVTKIIQT